MTHNDLINEVTRQLTSRFLPNPFAIKKRIEALLDVRGIIVVLCIALITDRARRGTIWIAGRTRSRMSML